MPSSNKYRYRCPGCTFEGKFQATRRHVRECCPSLLVNPDGSEVGTNKLKKSLIRLPKPPLPPKVPQFQKKDTIEPVASDRGAMPSVKKIRKIGGRCQRWNKRSKRWQKQKCRTSVDPGQLYGMTCIDCGARYDLSGDEDLAEYLWCRRRTRKELGLLSVTIAFDEASCFSLSTMARRCGITSNTAIPHLTCVEGLVANMKFGSTYLKGLQALRWAFLVDPSIRIDLIHTVPRRSDERTCLVVASVSASPGVSDASKTMSGYGQACVFPQFPFHVALGACSKQNSTHVVQQISDQLVGTILSAADSRMHLAVLPPPADDKLFLFSSNQEHIPADSHEERARKNFKKFPAISTAIEMASILNQSLASSPTNTWTRAEATESRKMAPTLAPMRGIAADSTTQRIELRYNDSAQNGLFPHATDTWCTNNATALSASDKAAFADHHAAAISTAAFNAVFDNEDDNN